MFKALSKSLLMMMKYLKKSRSRYAASAPQLRDEGGLCHKLQQAGLLVLDHTLELVREGQGFGGVQQCVTPPVGR